jgi:hypothetical protein
MKKTGEDSEDGLRPEYRREDLGKGIRGKYHEEYTTSMKLVRDRQPQSTVEQKEEKRKGKTI